MKDQITMIMTQCTAETPSNGDKIRRMTDEELAEFFEREIGDSVPTDWRDWLKQEVLR